MQLLVLGLLKVLTQQCEAKTLWHQGNNTHYVQDNNTHYVVLKDDCPNDIKISIGAHKYFQQTEAELDLYYFKDFNNFESISFARQTSNNNYYHHYPAVGSSSSLTSTEQLCENTFQPATFLHYFRHKTITFCGDSISRQLFNALNAKLQHGFVSKFNVHYNDPKPTPTYPFKFPVFRAYYPDYNFTLVYCGDSDAKKLLLLLHHHQHHTPSCVHEMLDHSDYVILGFALWWQPGGEKKVDYEKSADHFRVSFEEDMRQSRLNIEQYLQLTADHNRIDGEGPTIFWKLSSHVGDKEERKAYQKLPFYAFQDTVWSVDYAQNEASWIKGYNNILRSIASKYQDQIIDHYMISQLFLQAMIDLKVTHWVHSDFMHYVINGLPSAMALVIFDALVAADKNNNKKNNEVVDTTRK